MSLRAGVMPWRRLSARRMLAVVVVLVVTLTGLLVVPAAAGAQPPQEWAKSCSSATLGLGRDVVELAPSLAGDTNPDGTRVAISADSRGKFVPVIVVHGWTSKDTHRPERDGAFSHIIDLTANRLGQANTTRSLIGQLQRDRGTAVFTFDYRDYAASWVDDVHLGPALGKVIDCLYRASGQKVIIVSHSMGGLIARYAATHQGVTGGNRAGEISTVITFGTPETGSVAALLSAAAANGAAEASKPLAVLHLILSVCGQLSSTQIQTGTLCDALPAQVRTFDSKAGVALRAGSAQLAALNPFPVGINVDALAGSATFELPGAGWFALPWNNPRVDVGDLIVTSGSAMQGANSTRKVSCAYQLNAAQGASDQVGLAFGLVSKADVAQQPLAAFSGPCFHTQLMRSIELTNEATGAVTDDIKARQPSETPAPVAISIGSVSRNGRSTSPKFAFSLKLPGLIQAKSTTTTRWQHEVERIEREKRAALTEWMGRGQCDPPTNSGCETESSLDMRWLGRVLSNRYASAAVLSDYYASGAGVNQNDVDTITMALDSGKNLTATDVFDIRNPSFVSAIVRKMKSGLACGGQLPSKTTNGGVAVLQGDPALKDFTVNADGVTFWFDRYEASDGACSVASVTIDWATAQPYLTSMGADLRKAARS
jgi:pimeloyl-ACP methyl ester carboxylesterase